MKSGRRSRRSPFAPLAAVAIAGALAVFLLSRRATTIDGDGVPQADSSDAAPTPVPLAALDASRARHGARKRGANGAPDGESRSVTVRGRVLLPTGVVARDGDVHVFAPGGIDGDVVLASARLAPDLRFEIHGVRAPADVTRWKVAAVIPGAPTGFAEAAATAAGDVEVEIDLRRAETRERSLTARVVDGVGRSIAGLPVFVESMGDRTFLPVFRTEASRTGDRSGRRATATTDAEGRFLVEGFAAGAYTRAGSGSPAWFILPDHENRAFHERDVTLTAWPAAELDLTVLDAKGGPMPEFRVEVVPSTAPGWERDGRNGRLRTLWPRGATSKDRVTIDVAITASGFAPATEHYALGAGDARVAATVRMAAKDPAALGTVEVTLVGAPRRVWAELRLRRAGHRAKAAAESLYFHTDRRTTGASVPEGSWEFTIGDEDGEEAALAMTGRVDVYRGQVARLAWHQPVTGRLSIEGLAGSRLALESAEDGSARRIPYWHLLVMPVGTWTITLEDANGRAIASAKATVTEGETTVVRLD